jgi:hypothetical protein
MNDCFRGKIQLASQENQFKNYSLNIIQIVKEHAGVRPSGFVDLGLCPNGSVPA